MNYRRVCSLMSILSTIENSLRERSFVRLVDKQEYTIVPSTDRFGYSQRVFFHVVFERNGLYTPKELNVFLESVIHSFSLPSDCKKNSYACSYTPIFEKFTINTCPIYFNLGRVVYQEHFGKTRTEKRTILEIDGEEKNIIEESSDYVPLKREIIIQPYPDESFVHHPGLLEHVVYRNHIPTPLFCILAKTVKQCARKNKFGKQR